MTLSRNGFQTFVQRNPAPAVIGDFASMNPRASALAGEGAFRAANTLNYLGAINSPVIGRAAWGQGSFAYGQRPAGGRQLGFIANEQQTVIPFLAPGAGVDPVRLAIEAGFGTTLFTRGDFWTVPDSPVAGIVSAGDTVYARPADGTLTNDPVAFSATGVQALTTMTISAVTKGALVPGMALSGTTAGSLVASQLTGTPGGAGTYQMTVSETVGSATVTSAAEDTGFKWQSPTVADAAFTGVIAANTGILTASAVTGLIGVGQSISGTGVANNVFITAQLTGTAGGAGTYQLNTFGPAVGSTAMTSTEGKLAKISRPA